MSSEAAMATRVPPTPSPPGAYPIVVGREMEELNKFHQETRALLNNRKYSELESLANRIRSSKERTDSGGWKIVYFYVALKCRNEDPDSVWKLHNEIHREWIAKYPPIQNQPELF